MSLSYRSILHARNTGLMVEQDRWGVSSLHSQAGALGTHSHSLLASAHHVTAELLGPDSCLWAGVTEGGLGKARRANGQTALRPHGWYSQDSGMSARSLIPPFHHGV